MSSPKTPSFSSGRKSSRQIPMDLAPTPDYRFDNFVTGPSNQDGFRLVKGWQAWPAPVLLLQGPKGSGKTHLGHAWAAEGHGGVFIDDAETQDAHMVFAAINKALAGEAGPLLLASTRPPHEWPHSLPDLHSRMKNTAVASLSDADDDVLEGIIRKLFDDTGRSVSRDLVGYIITRSPRSVPALRHGISELDMAARADKADMTKAFAVRFFNAQPDLFDDID
ncbi:hypothetical protein [Fretibacter rubidus]|uniref:hypothetical protein n=1 Tax=Fretibacter rubidus TaxID=570162 RepID=UPI00352A70DB